MPTKAIDIIRPALRRLNAIGATEQPKASQIATALDCLNGILDTWSVTALARTRPVEAIATLPAGAQTLGIGPAAAVNVARPMRIESVYARAFGLDQDVEVVSKETYDSVLLKTTGTTWPAIVWYDQGLPTGLLHFWPVPTSDIELHVTVNGAVRPYTGGEDAQELPGGCLRALTLAVAVEASFDFQVPAPPALVQAAQAAYTAMTRQNVVVPELQSDAPRQSRLGQFLGGQ